MKTNKRRKTIIVKDVFNVYKAWDINIILTYIIEDFTTNFHIQKSNI